MPLWYIYYRVLRECRRSPLPGPEIRLFDVLTDLREKAILECTWGWHSLAFHEFMEKVVLEDILDLAGLLEIISKEPWFMFNPVKQGDK